MSGRGPGSGRGPESRRSRTAPERVRKDGSGRAGRSSVPFYKASLGRGEVREATSAILSGWLTTGPRVKEFEDRFRRLVGSRHAVAVNSCTAALHLALAAVGVRRGSEVITSPYTFAATGETILYLGARPVFADIDPVTLNVDPGAVRRALTRLTRAIVPVHIGGLPCDMEAIRDLVRGKRVPVVEDAAHALGARIGGRPIGSLSEMTCFSFYATKNLTTGEGGMLTTDDGARAERVRRLSLHGLTRDAWGRYARSGSWRYDVVEMGYKYNMTDVAAGLGLAQLRKFETMQRRRRAIAERYRLHLRECGAFDLPSEPRDARHAWHLYIVRLRPGRLRVGRDRLIELLRSRGIGTSVHFQPLHLLSFYRRTFGYRRGSFPNAERESARAISLPLYPSLEAGEQDRVIEALLDVARRYGR
ncbi:MAG: DegT/DnrJ/EryC1/StrS family aminotransferase [Acidobacteriota bacterium]